MIRAHCKLFFFFLVLVLLAGCVQISPAPSRITARMLVEPEALMGRGPANLAWSPVGAQLLYTEAEDGENALWLYDPETDAKQRILKPSALGMNLYLDLIQWSPDASAVLIPGEEGLYLLRLADREFQLLSPDKSIATSAFSPSGNYVSFTREHDLYLLEVISGRITRLTTNGDQDTFNGCLDWVYTEEMASRAEQPVYAWSPDSRRLLYLSLDDSSVENHPTADFQPIPEEVSWIRYPVAGSPNPKPSLWCAQIGTEEKPQAIPLPVDTEYVLPIFAWTPDAQEVWFLAENRDHSWVKLQAWNPITQSVRTVLQETDPYWINENNLSAPIFLPGGKEFLWLSERSGFMHLYLYQSNGGLVRPLTTGDWLVESAAWNLLAPTRAIQTDPVGKFVYFSSTKTSPLERQLFRLEIGSGRLDQLSQAPGFHAGILSSNGEYLVECFSNVDQPPVFSILQSDGAPKALLRRCAGPALNLPRCSGNSSL
jgi:dipeptidyl-peptidase-4